MQRPPRTAAVPSEAVFLRQALSLRRLPARHAKFLDAGKLLALGLAAAAKVVDLHRTRLRRKRTHRLRDKRLKPFRVIDLRVLVGEARLCKRRDFCRDLDIALGGLERCVVDLRALRAVQCDAVPKLRCGRLRALDKLVRVLPPRLQALRERRKRRALVDQLLSLVHVAGDLFRELLGPLRREAVRRNYPIEVYQVFVCQLCRAFLADELRDGLLDPAPDRTLAIELPRLLEPDLFESASSEIERRPSDFHRKVHRQHFGEELSVLLDREELSGPIRKRLPL